MQKRKSGFNIIDVLIILLVLAVGFGAYFLFFRSDAAMDENVGDEKVKVRYVLQVSELPAEYKDNIKAGEPVIDCATHISAGDIVAVGSEDFVYVGHDKTTGEQKLTTVKDYVNLYITVEGEASLFKEMYVINNTSVYVGKKIDLMMPELFCGSTCISMEVID